MQFLKMGLVIYPFGLKGIFYYSALAINMGRTWLWLENVHAAPATIYVKIT